MLGAAVVAFERGDPSALRRFQGVDRIAPTSEHPLVDELRRAVATPGSPAPAVRESHGAWVVLTPDRAYKLRKPVRFAFVDYSTPSARRAALEAELAVNAELRNGLMPNLCGVRLDSGAAILTEPDDPAAVDWVLVMRRYDEERTMASLLLRGSLTGEQVRGAARRIAAFHASAMVVEARDPSGRVTAAVGRNLTELARSGGDERLAVPGELLLAAVDAHGSTLEARARAGLVRDGHGDLRAEHVVLADGEVLLVDRLEFDPALRRVDVADDLSFLVMDLEARGAAWAARTLVAGYVDAGGNPGAPALMAMFAAHRALVRAKVAVLRAGQDLPAESGGDAAGLVALAARLAWRALAPMAIVVCGPPASGKSTLSRALADRADLGVVSSDGVRKETRGLALRARAPAGAYTAAARAAVYSELGRRARAVLTSGDSVLVDATFGESAFVASFLGALGPGQRLHVLECRAPADVRAGRAAADDRSGSDAGPAVAGRLAEHHARTAELGPPIVVDGTAAAAEQLATIELGLARAGGRCGRPSAQS